MSRRLARAGRLGQRSTGQGKPWSPAAIPDLEGWWSADDALASVGPDVAARPGDSIRSVPDRSRHKRSMDQTTANRQPMLGYLRPPKGNMVAQSGDTMNPVWGVVFNNGTKELYAETDPEGNPATLITTTADPAPTNTGLIQIIDVFTEGEAVRVQLWVKLIVGDSIRICAGGNCTSVTPEAGEWELVEVVRTTGPNKNFIVGVAPAGIERQFAVGRVSITPITWSDEYVDTESEPIIPDTTDLPRAMVFDGVVGNMLETSSNALGNAPDVTIVAVHGIQASSLTGISGFLLSGSGRAAGGNVGEVRNSGERRFARWGQYSVDTGTSIEPRRAYLDIMYQRPDGRVVFRNGGQQYGSSDQSPPNPYSTTAYGIGAENLSAVGSYANGPITDVLYFTRALSDSEIQRVEDYFLIKSGINRITTDPAEVKELETVKALAPGIWYLDGVAISAEPVRQIVVPAGSAGQELTVNDSYGIEVLP